MNKMLVSNAIVKACALGTACCSTSLAADKIFEKHDGFSKIVPKGTEALPINKKQLKGGKKMKRILIGLIAMFLVLSLFSVSVMAQEDAEVNDAGATDNDSANIVISPAPETAQLDQATTDEINDDLSEQVGPLDVFMAKVGIWLTFNQEKKAEKELKLARLELIRARIAAKNGNEKAMEKALEAHSRIIEKVQARINAIDGKSTEEGIKDSATKLVGLERAVEVHEARVAKLNEILLSGNLTEEQIEKIQARMDKARESVAHLKEVQAAKKVKIKEKLMAVAEMTDENATEEIEEIEDSQKLDAVKKKVREVKAIRGEKAAEVLSNVIDKLVARQAETGKDVSSAISKLTVVRDKIVARIEVAPKNQIETVQEGNESTATA